MKKLTAILMLVILCGCQTTTVLPEHDVYQYDSIDSRTDYPLVILETKF
jgi:hypothetical protein